jgi:hypothetical protein
MENYVLVLFFLGIIITIIGHYRSNPNCPKTKIEYRFVDKTIEEAQKSGQQSVFNDFITMFTDPPILI